MKTYLSVFQFEDVKRSLVNFITFMPNLMYLTVAVFNSTDVYDLLPTYDNQTALDDAMRRNMISALIDLQLQPDGNSVSGLSTALDQSLSVYINIYNRFVINIFLLKYFLLNRGQIMAKT